MVEMRVEIPDIPLGFFVVQLRPGDDATAGTVPPQRHGIGRLAQPVRFATLHVIPVLAPENGIGFSPLQAIIAAHAVTPVFRKIFFHVIDLMDDPFLDAEQVGLRSPDHPDNGLPPVIPAVVTVKIITRRKPDVESHHADFRRTGGLAGSQQHPPEGRNKQESNQPRFFHSPVRFLQIYELIAKFGQL